MDVITLEVPELGNRCHLVHDGASALVVDPPRHLTAVERAAEDAGVEIAAVADTHVHNDYLSGALGLARRHGADYLLAADEHVAFERVGVRGGELVQVGGLEVRVLDTPGHTRHHQSFHVTDPAHGAGHPGAVFSGGSLLDGTVGRTDLVHENMTTALARAQWSSARDLAALDPATHLHPTHGFGSFCASTAAGSSCTTPTIGGQLATNPALLADCEEFVADLLAGFGPIPAYYDHMGPLNRVAAGRALPRPARAVGSEELADAVSRGAWVVDLRDRADFAAGHLTDTVGVEYSTQFATYVGWLAPWEHELVLLTDRLPDLAPAIRDLAAIGIEGVGIHVLGDDAPLESSFARTDWAGFRSHPGGRVVVDVRQRDEWEAGRLPGAVHVPVQDVADRAGELPAGELWVHCRSGYRAGIAASLLHRLGRRVVHVDDAWDRVSELDIPTERGLAA
ncbi:glyoxylase-like metal-dependent hydrolase (beta-lactamase superfamily II)/rhodanese-related sulfurtransferase [Nocardioides ginsengisegetis]|uniref:Glyoxylase-like metal-dependent hydrolase (Beta-lactamase superfamily II)/rhodanese-related sulfurtransferase n=1 Tax=Nocardioides ginsengisegetis TaxID=661491 RepID=A0A7W3PA36_9ACTN|nr:rhodanese-like domain-containing protein [Nocardioides ginsengisegetis]MBA8804089.1 glyoxylase-like metal-dependent hydrolase (beta-lactamase superfamily II)/rhodanese-related sulfurtransferase [Nocardioides ginsengisegetis]